MSEFPTGTAPVELVDEGRDKVKLARPGFAVAFNLINQIIGSFNQALGICGLDAMSRVSTSKLEARVDNLALQDDAVRSRHIQAGEVTAKHLKMTITNNPAPPTGGADGDMHFIYE